jgi:ribosomal protein RSM22 (predicted rRNA methylase)
MELPPALRQEVDLALTGVPLADLARAAEALSRRYRGEVHDGRFHIADDLAARAYLATRLPATYAAIRAALSAVAGLRPGYAPKTVLDVGAGPGAALWAAHDCWPGVADAVLIEGSPSIRRWGETLARALPVARISWETSDITGALSDRDARDLVLLSYVLGELTLEAKSRLVGRLWSLTTDTLVIVEPGTPAGWQRILRAREQLIASGAHVVAPCPHAHACPLEGSDWCHFARRVARSRLHRQAKGGEVPWEDEKYIYLAVSRRPGISPQARVIAHPRAASGRVTLKLCRSGGDAVEQLFSRRAGATYAVARRLDWGDALP